MSGYMPSQTLAVGMTSVIGSVPVCFSAEVVRVRIKLFKCAEIVTWTSPQAVLAGAAEFEDAEVA
jgi:hypothetical protein